MKKFQIKDKDIHSHIKARMLQRGITKEEIERTLGEGWQADDAKKGTSGKVFVFTYNKKWERKFFEEKEVRVYYKYIDDNFVLLTVKAKYSKEFPKREGV